jgi:formylglycine-generating enzyme required for sulfatase activity
MVRKRLMKLMASILSPLMILFILFGISCQKIDKPAIKTPKVIKTKTGVEMVLIPAGWFRYASHSTQGFEMGNNRGRHNESPVHKVWVDAFLRDKYAISFQSPKKCETCISEYFYAGGRKGE